MIAARMSARSKILRGILPLLALTLLAVHSASADEFSEGVAPRQEVSKEKPPAHTVSGVVRQKMEAKGYTYVAIDTGGGLIWAAGPTTKVAVGDSVRLPDGQSLPNFESKTLGGLIFPSITFASAIEVKR